MVFSLTFCIQLRKYKSSEESFPFLLPLGLKNVNTEKIFYDSLLVKAKPEQGKGDKIKKLLLPNSPRLNYEEIQKKNYEEELFILMTLIVFRQYQEVREGLPLSNQSAASPFD